MHVDAVDVLFMWSSCTGHAQSARHLLEWRVVDVTVINSLRSWHGQNARTHLIRKFSASREAEEVTHQHTPIHRGRPFGQDSCALTLKWLRPGFSACDTRIRYAMATDHVSRCLQKPRFKFASISSCSLMLLSLCSAMARMGKLALQLSWLTCPCCSRARHLLLFSSCKATSTAGSPGIAKRDQTPLERTSTASFPCTHRIWPSYNAFRSAASEI